MVWVAVDKRGDEAVFETQPQRNKHGMWSFEDSQEGEYFDNYGIELPFGSIEKLIGYNLTWENEPVELK